MNPYRLLLRAMFLLPPERIHHVAFTAMVWATRFGPLRALVRRVLAVRDPALVTRAFGVEFPTPVGLAAGFDKNGHGVDAWGPLGFGFAEVGTVTAQPQAGNPQPRLFRLPDDRGLLNRMGFNNPGVDEVADRLRRRHGDIPIGANIGKTKVVPAADAATDYTASARALGPLADFVVVNVSSPNTPGLRDLQAVESLRPLLAAVTRVANVPVLVKIAPDLSDDDVGAVADLALELGSAGIVATNTTIGRDGLRTPGAAELGAGGVSGPFVADRSLEVLRLLRARVGDRMTLISVGGIETADDAWERILAGATLVQGYTGFVYGGPFWARRIATGLAARARAAGYASVSDAVGAGR
ncbi:MAG: quinone-dependent dihydroorotate dehydrogenase [Rhodococcus sp. (in: high G+C Gram-positive bacteria)]